MADGVDAAWVERIATWAAGEPLIEAAYVFGSRVKGTYRDDSDLDVAVIVAGADEGERLGNAIFEKPRWIATLQPQLPVKLHLQCAMDDDIVVMPAVRDHGRLVYKADGCARQSNHGGSG
ncbi:nucleotidyltransferase domain-containing protein [Sphingomonas paucimobilis]|uniref:Nucleotidyltransferase domain-containing protein n=1 Tax=Sphingomonas paucimobilis TaxID=13689 RepID=A0A7Y2KTA8_SPHPI|nr:nucleotidyltransferase domain-containing protein [Sphingomonas paucimobilis]NNG59788.1 nucleotidyltransferase domain-containing protein [Sphingomonas paucimobilis]